MNERDNKAFKHAENKKSPSTHISDSGQVIERVGPRSSMSDGNHYENVGGMRFKNGQYVGEK